MATVWHNEGMDVFNKKLFLILIIFLFWKVDAQEYLRKEVKDEMGLFSATVTKINSNINMLRFRAGFSNFRYLNSKDKVEFWNEHNPNRKCIGFVKGKTSEHFLIKVQDIRECMQKVAFMPGGRIYFYSQDLANNIKMGRELIGILIKKRLALYGIMQQNKKELDEYLEKLDLVNKRYGVLKDKLELEWKQEIASLEEDQTEFIRDYKDLQLKVSEVDQKLEAYRIEEENLREDRWALDSKLYYQK